MKSSIKDALIHNHLFNMTMSYNNDILKTNVESIKSLFNGSEISIKMNRRTLQEIFNWSDKEINKIPLGYEQPIFVCEYGKVYVKDELKNNQILIEPEDLSKFDFKYNFIE